MATQYIEDPETKEKIPFEWGKPEPPTSSDIDSLFKSVKGVREKLTEKPPEKLPMVYGVPPGYEGIPSPTTGEIVKGVYDVGKGIVKGTIPFITPRKPGQPLLETPAPLGSAYTGHVVKPRASDFDRGPLGTEPETGWEPPKPSTPEQRRQFQKEQPAPYIPPELMKGGLLVLGGMGTVARAGKEAGTGMWGGAKAVAKKYAGEIEGAVEKGPSILPSWLRRGPGSFKTKAEEVFTGVKGPYEVEKGATTGLRKGAEKSMGELTNVEQQLYKKAEGLTPKGQKVNFENFTENLNKFEETTTFGRLKPPEKVEIRNVIKQIRKEISPSARGGRTQITPEELEDIMQTGTGEFAGGTGQVRMPGTFEQARATRSWLSEESAKSFQRGDKVKGIAYRDLKNTLEKDLEKSVGKDTWSAWKEADSFKTRKHIMDEVFGREVERRPGQYDFRKIKNRINGIPTERFKAAGFSNEEIKGLHKISDTGTFRMLVENHPSLKLVAPLAILQGFGIPVPGLAPLRHAASLTHIVPGGGFGGY